MITKHLFVTLLWITCTYCKILIQYSSDMEKSRVIYKHFGLSEKGNYIDFYPLSPVKGSDTAYLNSRGWNGINLLQNLSKMKQFEIHRQKDVNLLIEMQNINSSNIEKQITQNLYKNSIDLIIIHHQIIDQAFKNWTVWKHVDPKNLLISLFNKNDVKESKIIKQLMLIQGYDISQQSQSMLFLTKNTYRAKPLQKKNDVLIPLSKITSCLQELTQQKSIQYIIYDGSPLVLKNNIRNMSVFLQFSIKTDKIYSSAESIQIHHVVEGSFHFYTITQKKGLDVLKYYFLDQNFEQEGILKLKVINSQIQDSYFKPGPRFGSQIAFKPDKKQNVSPHSEHFSRNLKFSHLKHKKQDISVLLSDPQLLVEKIFYTTIFLAFILTLIFIIFLVSIFFSKKVGKINNALQKGSQSEVQKNSKSRQNCPKLDNIHSEQI